MFYSNLVAIKSIVFLCTFALLGCGGGDDQKPKITDGILSAMFNTNREWDANEVYVVSVKPAPGESCDPHSMDVMIRKWNHLEEGYVSTNEGLSVSSIQIEPGTQDLNRKINCNGSTRYYTLVGDDMLADIYQLDTLKVNEVRIEMVDTEKEKYRGVLN